MEATTWLSLNSMTKDLVLLMFMNLIHSGIRIKKMTRAKRTVIGRLNPDTGEVVPTDGRNRKTKATPAEEPADYAKLYKKLLRKSEAQEALIVSLKKQLEELKK